MPQYSLPVRCYNRAVCKESDTDSKQGIYSPENLHAQIKATSVPYLGLSLTTQTDTCCRCCRSHAVAVPLFSRPVVDNISSSLHAVAVDQTRHPPPRQPGFRRFLLLVAKDPTSTVFNALKHPFKGK